MNIYADIINLSRPETSHVKLGIESRASQFSPYAALVGYGDKIKEASRLTDKKLQLTEEEIEKLNNELNIIEKHIKERPRVSIKYFIKDRRKAGGRYVTREGIVKQIDSVNKVVVFTDNSKIKMNDIFSISNDIISKI